MRETVGTMMGDLLLMGWFMDWGVMVLCTVLGLSCGVVMSLGWNLPAVWRLKRRRELRRDWRDNVPRPLPVGLGPRWDEYDPDDESVSRRCVCHARKVHPGERVLLWPEVGPMGILHTAVYCESVKESV